MAITTVTFTINGHTYTNDKTNLAVPEGYRFIGYEWVPALANLVVDILAVAGQVLTNANAASSSASAAGTSATNAASSATSASSSASSASASATNAANSAAIAVAATGTCTYIQSNRIDADMTIPNGYNAITIGPFEVGPNVTVTGIGNSTWRGL